MRRIIEDADDFTTIFLKLSKQKKISSQNREIQVFLLHILKIDKSTKEKIAMENVIVLFIVVVVVLGAWFVIPYYIALFKKDVKRIRTSASFAPFAKAEQEIEKETAQSVVHDSENTNNAARKN